MISNSPISDISISSFYELINIDVSILLENNFIITKFDLVNYELLISIISQNTTTCSYNKTIFILNFINHEVLKNIDYNSPIVLDLLLKNISNLLINHENLKDILLSSVISNENLKDILLSSVISNEYIQNINRSINIDLEYLINSLNNTSYNIEYLIDANSNYTVTYELNLLLIKINNIIIESLLLLNTINKINIETNGTAILITFDAIILFEYLQKLIQNTISKYENLISIDVNNSTIFENLLLLLSNNISNIDYIKKILFDNDLLREQLILTNKSNQLVLEMLLINTIPKTILSENILNIGFDSDFIYNNLIIVSDSRRVIIDYLRKINFTGIIPIYWLGFDTEEQSIIALEYILNSRPNLYVLDPRMTYVSISSNNLYNILESEKVFIQNRMNSYKIQSNDAFTLDYRSIIIPKSLNTIILQQTGSFDVSSNSQYTGED